MSTRGKTPKGPPTQAAERPTAPEELDQVAATLATFLWIDPAVLERVSDNIHRALAAIPVPGLRQRIVAELEDARIESLELRTALAQIGSNEVPDVVEVAGGTEEKFRLAAAAHRADVLVRSLPGRLRAVSIESRALGGLVNAKYRFDGATMKRALQQHAGRTPRDIRRDAKNLKAGDSARASTLYAELAQIAMKRTAAANVDSTFGLLSEYVRLQTVLVARSTARQRREMNGIFAWFAAQRVLYFLGWTVVFGVGFIGLLQGLAPLAIAGFGIGTAGAVVQAFVIDPEVRRRLGASRIRYISRLARPYLQYRLWLVSLAALNAVTLLQVLPTRAAHHDVSGRET